jgi:hypothetical protein
MSVLGPAMSNDKAFMWDRSAIAFTNCLLAVAILLRRRANSWDDRPVGRAQTMK